MSQLATGNSEEGRRGWGLLLAVVGSVIATGWMVGTVEADGRRMEEIATGWVEAHNSGDVERMAAYRAAHRVDQGDGWREQFPGLVERLGRLEVAEVLIERPGEIQLVVTSPTRGRLLMTFAFSEDDTERVATIQIDSGGGQPNSLPELAIESSEWPTRRAEVDAYLADLVDDDLFSGVVLIAEDGAVVYEVAVGPASREFSVPNTLGTRFDIGSITKDFTRVAIAQLLAAGKLGIDDLVGEHLPDYPNAEVREGVTVRHLFEHRSGVGDYFTEEWSQTPMGALRDHADYIDIWGPKPLQFEPGSSSEYSNFGFTILGAIIEAASGESYFDYVHRHVFEPAGMSDTGFFETDAVVPDVAVGYTYLDRAEQAGDELRKNIYLEPAKGGPWGKTYATARDLWRFWDALSHHRLTAAAYTPWVLLDGPPPNAGETPAPAAPVTSVGLGGGGPGIAAVIEAGGGRVIIVLANLDPPSAMHLSRRLTDAL